jgi:hypothetical protein
MPQEAKARILINDLLRRAGWRFFDGETGQVDIALETDVKIKKQALGGRARTRRSMLMEGHAPSWPQTAADATERVPPE